MAATVPRSAPTSRGSDRPVSAGPLQARRILVVGASSGIGRALSLRAGAQGAKVVLAARRRDLVDETAAQITSRGGAAWAFACDVTDPTSCEVLCARAVEVMGGLDVLVYMAGSSPLLRIADTSREQWRALLEVNLVGAASVLARSLDDLKNSDAPVVVVTTHSMGSAPWPWLGVYGSTKAALAEMARALRKEEPGLRVICVSVGSTATAFADSWDPVTSKIAFENWIADGLLPGDVMDAADMAGSILSVVADPALGDDVLIHAGQIEKT